MNNANYDCNDRIPSDEWNRLREGNTTRLCEAVEALETRFNDGERRLRDEVQAVAELFRTLKPLDREQQPHLWEKFNALRDRMGQEHREFLARQVENARRLEDAIGTLEHRHCMSWLDEMCRDANRLFALPEGQRVDFAAIWRDIKDVQDLFKECKPLRRQQQEELWNRFNRFRDRVREFQNLHQSRYEHDCDVNRNQIERAIQTLQSTYNLGWGQAILGSQGGLKGFGDDARTVSELFKTCKPLRKDDREELWNSFNGVRDKASAVREQQQQQWRNGQREHTERLRGFIAKNEEFIARMQSQIEADGEKRDGARKREFADTVQSWIDQKQDKIREVENSNSELFDKIAAIERRLDS